MKYNQSISTLQRERLIRLDALHLFSFSVFATKHRQLRLFVRRKYGEKRRSFPARNLLCLLSGVSQTRFSFPWNFQAFRLALVFSLWPIIVFAFQRNALFRLHPSIYCEIDYCGKCSIESNNKICFVRHSFLRASKPFRAYQPINDLIPAVRSETVESNEQMSSICRNRFLS